MKTNDIVMEGVKDMVWFGGCFTNVGFFFFFVGIVVFLFVFTFFVIGF